MSADFYATQLRKELGLSGPPFLPQDAFKALDVVYQELTLDGCLGMTLRINGNIGVMVSANIPEEGKKLFTAAHELGHVIIPSHAKISSFKCTSNDIVGASKKPQEIEASQFAAEWLMPKEIFKPLCKTTEPDFQSISSLADVFNVTLTAAATRFVDVSDHELMMVVSENGFMKYFRASQGFPYKLDWGKVPNTYARSNLVGKSFPIDFMTVASDEWFRGTQPEDGEVLECSIKLGDYDTVLTMLWIT